MNNLTPLLGRTLLSIIFLVAGYGKVADPAGTMHYMAAHGMPIPAFFLVCTIIVELGGGLSLLVGYKARWGAAVLTIFLVPVTLIFHTKFADPIQTIMFLKNFAIMGGLLMVASAGPGPISLDGRSRHENAPKSLSR